MLDAAISPCTTAAAPPEGHPLWRSIAQTLLQLDAGRPFLQGRVGLRGHGQVDAGIALALQGCGIPPPLIDQNRQRVDRLRRHGPAAVSVDACGDNPQARDMAGRLLAGFIRLATGGEAAA